MKNNKSVANWKVKFFQAMKEMVIAHLRNISNQEVKVPIPNIHDDISVKDLIGEVEQETLTGLKYMIEWANTQIIIQQELRKK